MKILLLAPQPFYQERGTPMAVRLLCETLGAAGHSIDMVTYHEGQNLDLPQTIIHRIEPPGFIKNIRPGLTWQKIAADFYLFQKARQLLSRKSFDLMHAVEESAFMAWYLGKKRHLPYIYDMDSSLPQQIQEKFPQLNIFNRLLTLWEKKAVQNSLSVIAVCKALQDLAHLYAPGKPCLRLEDISLLQEKTGQEELNLPGTLAMYVGNLESYQGIDLFMESMALAVPRNKELQAVIIGGRPQDIAHYQAKAAQLEINGHTHFLGPRPPDLLAHYLAQAHILVSPRCKGANTPMKIYSYLDSGIPVLATRLSTHTQVMDDDIACLAEPDPQSMATGLLRLAADPGLRQRLARAAKQRVQQEYSRPVYEKKLNDFYDQMAAKLRLAPLANGR